MLNCCNTPPPNHLRSRSLPCLHRHICILLHLRVLTWTHAQETRMKVPLLNLASLYQRSSCPLVPFPPYLNTTMADIWRLLLYHQMKGQWQESCWLDLFHQCTQTAAERHLKDSVSLSDETCQCFKIPSLGAHKSSDAVPQTRLLLTHIEPILLVMLTALDKTDNYMARSSKHFIFSSWDLHTIWGFSELVY